MAEAFFNKLSHKNFAVSAGVNRYNLSRYNGKVSDVPKANVVRLMKEKGMDVSANKIKIVNKEMVQHADLIIAIMTKKRAQRDLPKYVVNSPRFRLWEIEDTNARHRTETVYMAQKRNRDKIYEYVQALVKEIG
jgi:protein-tyrosine-phosphatase